METRADTAQPSVAEPRIHVLGIGNIGRLFAHSLARLPNRPPITLLFHRQSLAEEFERAGRTIEIITNGTSNKQFGFDYEVVIGAEKGSEKGLSQESRPIDNLVLGTKATQTLRALESIQHRLHPSSTILFTQNGLSTTSHLSKLFPTPSTQPNVLTSVVFHGIYSLPSRSLFSSTHAGIGFLPIAATSLSPPTTSTGTKPLLHHHQYLLRTILALPAINAVAVSPTELLIIQLEKLVVNAIINPLTALLRLRNGQLYDEPRLEPLIRALIKETGAVVCAAFSEMLVVVDEGEEEREKGGTGTAEQVKMRERFGEGTLWVLVREKALLTAGNRSSMLQDVESGKGETEVAFINGWVVERGRELGIRVPISEKVVDLVEERRVVTLDEVGELLGCSR